MTILFFSNINGKQVNITISATEASDTNIDNINSFQSHRSILFYETIYAKIFKIYYLLFEIVFFLIVMSQQSVMFSYDIGLTSIYNARVKKVYFSEHKIEKSSKVKGNFSDYIHENRTSELEIYLIIVRTKHYLTTFLGDEIDSEGLLHIKCSRH